MVKHIMVNLCHKAHPLRDRRACLRASVGQIRAIVSDFFSVDQFLRKNATSTYEARVS